MPEEANDRASPIAADGGRSWRPARALEGSAVLQKSRIWISGCSPSASIVLGRAEVQCETPSLHVGAGSTVTSVQVCCTCQVSKWPEAEAPRRPRFGRDQMESGHEADIARRPSLTHIEHDALSAASYRAPPCVERGQPFRQVRLSG